MTPMDHVRELWRRRDYLQVLTEAWNLDAAVSHSALRNPALGLTLGNVVFNACHFAVAELGGRLGDRGKATQWIDHLVTRPVPNSLVNHHDLELNDRWCRDYRTRMILAHLLCARAAIQCVPSREMPREALEAINADLRTRGVEPLPLGFLNDLSGQLLRGRRSRGRAFEAFFPLVSSDGHQENALIAKFVLEPLQRRVGDVFVAVEQAFVPIDGDFECVLRDAPHLLTQEGLCSPSGDVSVRVERAINPGLVETPLLGSSGGGALAIGLWSTWMGKEVPNDVIASFAVRHSSGMAPDGRCHPVELGASKLNAVQYHARTSMQETTFLVASSQQMEFSGASGVTIRGCEELRTAINVAEGNRRKPHEAPAPVSTPEDGYWVPCLPSRLFSGRASLLAKCRELLEFKGRVALFGLGGMGKTQTALAYAHEYGRKQNAYRFVFWANADSDVTLTADYIRFAWHLNLSEKGTRDQTTVIAAVKDWLEKHDQWLLVLDSANELASVQQFFPRTTRGHILLTTQCPWPGGVAEPLEILPFGPADGATLLLRRAGLVRGDGGLAEVSVEDREAAVAISTEFDGLPLALDQAGAYIEVMQVSPADYLQRFHNERNAPQLLADDSGIEFRSYPKTVATTWRMNFFQVTQEDPAAGDLLRLCSLMAPDAVPEEAIFAATHIATSLFGLKEPLRLDAALRVAAKFSLLRRDRRSRAVSMHRLVQSVQRHLMDSVEVSTWLQVALNALVSAYPASAQPKHWAEISRLEPHAIAILSACESNSSVNPLLRAKLLGQLGMYSLARSQIKLGNSRLEEARSALLDAVANMYGNVADAVLEEHDGMFTLSVLAERDSEFVTTALFVMKNLVAALVKFDPDNPLCETYLKELSDQALAVWGEDDFEYLETRMTTAELHQKRGELREAEEILSDVLVRADSSAQTIFIRANCLTGLSQCKLQQGDCRSAESLVRELLRVGRSKLGEEVYASALHSMGNVYLAREDPGAAESFCRESVEIRRELYGDQHQAVAEGLLQLVMVCSLTGRMSEAEALAQEAAEITKNNLGLGHPMFDFCLRLLVQIYSEQGKNIVMEVEFFGEKPPTGLLQGPSLEGFKDFLSDPSNDIRNIRLTGREHSDVPRAPGLVGTGHDRSYPRVERLSRVSRVGRNEPCPCGSGKKFKRCCGRPSADDTRNGH